MGDVHARIGEPDEHRPAPGGDGPGLGRVDLIHVPLAKREQDRPWRGGGGMGGRLWPVAATGPILLDTDLTAPTAAIPPVARNVVANDALDERARTAPTFG